MKIRTNMLSDKTTAAKLLHTICDIDKLPYFMNMALFKITPQQQTVKIYGKHHLKIRCF